MVSKETKIEYGGYGVIAAQESVDLLDPEHNRIATHVMNKIAIIGISGSGKSTFSRKLASKTNLPLFHADQLFWKGNWEAVSEAQYLQEHEILIKKDMWIIEGFVDVQMADRLSKADLVLYLDYSGLRCVRHLISRWLKHRNESRPELPKEAREKLELSFLWRVLTRQERVCIEDALKIAQQGNVLRFYNPKQLQDFLDELPKEL